MVKFIPEEPLKLRSALTEMKATKHRTQVIHNQELSTLLAQFEKENAAWLEKETIDGWNLWFSIKKTLYYFLKNQAHESTSASAPVTAGKHTLVFAFSRVLFVIFKEIFSGKKDILITDSINKLTKDETGYYMDVFVDPLIHSGAIRDYIYLETSQSGQVRKPVKVRNINHNGRALPIMLFRKWHERRKDLRSKAETFSVLLNNWLSQHGSTIRISRESILLLITNYIGQLKWYSIFWRLVRPRRIFTVDSIPEGSIPAARKLGIPVYEFQHGFITNNKPDYIIPGWLKSRKSKMAVPDYVCVFGDYFKEIMLKDGFWEGSEVVGLGSYVVDNARKEYSFHLDPHGPVQILWTTQPSTFQQTTRLLEDLSLIQLKNATITFKLHPRESESNAAWYRSFCGRNPGIFTIDPNPQFFKVLNQKHLLISYHSTTLLEAMAVGCPVISIATGQFKNGINDFLDADVSDVILAAKDAEDIAGIINRFINDRAFTEGWSKASKEKGRYFFTEGYEDNIRKFFKESQV